MNEQRVDSAIKQAVYYRNYRRARERALTKLAQMYPDNYQDLLEKEKESDEQLGKKWLDINGTTASSLVDTRTDTTATRPQALYSGEDEGDNGGEE